MSAPPAARRPRVLIFAPWFPPHGDSEAIVAGKHVLTLLKRGWSVDVVSSATAAGDRLEPFWTGLGPSIHAVPIEGAGIRARWWGRVAGTLRTGHPVTRMAWVHGAVRLGASLARRARYDAVFSRSQPVQGHLPAMVVARRAGLPWAASWNDVEPWGRAPGPYGGGIGARGPYFVQRLVTAAMQRAAHHVFPSEPFRAYMERMYPVIAGRASVIPHVALDPPADGTAAQPLRGPFVLCHAGTFDRRRNPHTFFAALEQFRARRPGVDVRVRFLGNSPSGTSPGDVPASLQRCVEVVPRLGYGMALAAMREASVLLMVEARMDEPIWLAGKFPDYVQCRRPILAIASPGSTIDSALRRQGGGEAVAVGDVPGALAALERLYGSWESGRMAADYPQEHLAECFGEERVAAGWAHVIERLWGSGTP